MLSQTAEYALRAAVHLGRRFEDPQTTRAIAEATQVPEGYLAKVLQALGRAGLVRSQRGLHGGFILARPPIEVSIFDVVHAVDPVRRIDTCPLGRDHGDARLCTLHQTLDDVLAWVEASFRTASIADMLSGPPQAQPLCPRSKCEHGSCPGRFTDRRSLDGNGGTA